VVKFDSVSYPGISPFPKLKHLLRSGIKPPHTRPHVDFGSQAQPSLRLVILPQNETLRQIKEVARRD
jgi:hypothetical protein